LPFRGVGFLFLLVANLVTFKYFLLFFVVIGGCLEEFVARVFGGGKVTVPRRLRVCNCSGARLFGDKYGV
jgi:hypothetical protein